MYAAIVMFRDECWGLTSQSLRILFLNEKYYLQNHFLIGLMGSRILINN